MAPRTSGKRRMAGGGAGARIPRGCKRIPAPNPATGGAPNPAPLAGHPAGQGSSPGLGSGFSGSASTLRGDRPPGINMTEVWS